MIAKHSIIINGVLYRKGQEIPIDEPEPITPPEPEPEPEVEPEIEPAELPKL